MIRDKKQSILAVFSGTLVAVATTLILILLFATLIRFFNISDSWIFPVNQVIKIISIFVGTLIVLNKTKSKGFVNGLLLGLIYYILSTVVFSILQGSFTLKMSNLYDLFLTMLIGGIVGIIIVNIKKR